MHTYVNVPFVDLQAPHRELEEELSSVFRQTLRSAAFIGGPVVEQFETAFAELCQTNCCIAVSSGTDALRFAIMACGIAVGDVILTVPNTFIATTEAISQAGAIPEFVDVDEGSFNMSVAALREFLEDACTRDRSGRLISPRSHRPIAAILPVHLYGQMADMDAIIELAKMNNLLVIEDACQAHGAEYYSKRNGRWMRAGSMGQAAAFSFYPGKNLGACGEGGAVTTDDLAIARRIRMLRDHGQVKKYYHDSEGYNGRLDAVQAGILHAKLVHLDEWNRRRRQCAAEYGELLGDIESVQLPVVDDGYRSVYHLYVIRTEGRDEMIRWLAERGVGTGIHYPIPLHLQNAYSSMNYARGDFPIAEAAAEEIISLPMHPHLTPEMQAAVSDAVHGFSASVAGRPYDASDAETASVR